MRELLEDHGLANGVGTQVRLKAKGLDYWNLNAEDGQGTAWLGFFTGDMSSPSDQHIIYSLNAVMWTGDLCNIEGFHDARLRKEEGRVTHSTRSRNQLSTSSLYWL